MTRPYVTSVLIGSTARSAAWSDESPYDAPVDEGRTALHEEVEALRAILANIGLDDATDAEESIQEPHRSS